MEIVSNTLHYGYFWNGRRIETITKLSNVANKGNTKESLHKVSEIEIDDTTLQGLIDFSKVDEPPLKYGLNQHIDDNAGLAILRTIY